MDVNDLGPIDGVDVWESLISNKPSPRSEVLINIDDIDNYAAIRRGDFKYVIGHTSSGDDWYGDPGRIEAKYSGVNFSEEYPQKVLSSKAGIAISGLTTARQVNDLRRRRRNRLPQKNPSEYDTRMLTVDDIKNLRSEASVGCKVKQEEKVKQLLQKYTNFYNLHSLRYIFYFFNHLPVAANRLISTKF